MNYTDPERFTDLVNQQNLHKAPTGHGGAGQVDSPVEAGPVVTNVSDLSPAQKDALTGARDEVGDGIPHLSPTVATGTVVALIDRGLVLASPARSHRLTAAGLRARKALLQADTPQVDPTRCPNPWHRTANARMAQSCPECPPVSQVDPLQGLPDSELHDLDLALGDALFHWGRLHPGKQLPYADRVQVLHERINQVLRSRGVTGSNPNRSV